MSGRILSWLKRVPGLQRLAWMYHVDAIVAERDRLKAALADCAVAAHHDPQPVRRERDHAQPRDPVALATALPKGAWLWCDLEVRRRIQAHGINVVPTNFYSNTPSIADIEGSFEYASDEPPYVLPADPASLDAELASLTRYASEFSAPHQDPGDSSYFWDNGLFSGADAMAYYCYLRKLAPQRVVEIGSGYSSLVALMALKANSKGRLTCIEPYPRDFLKGRHDLDLLQETAQDITAERLNDLLADGDVLFIDSTHTVKAGSDCLHIYLRLLPHIRRRITVHVHDVHLPFAMPKGAMLEKQCHWTEQYLLLAFLLDNPKARIRFGTVYHAWRNPGLLEGLMGGKAPAIGASFWFEYQGA
ncbi:MAG TPA: class I SAM-dependent methyltransferase [Gammaproteobacteria bacterium]|nr:class I SAM-dependent methyltransferase [Gammaproteobacteria bacterium]